MFDDKISNLKARQSKHNKLNHQQNEKVGQIESADGVLTQPTADASSISDMHPATVTVKGFPAFLFLCQCRQSLFLSSSASASASVCICLHLCLRLRLGNQSSCFSSYSRHPTSLYNRWPPSIYKYAPQYQNIQRLPRSPSVQELKLHETAIICEWKLPTNLEEQETSWHTAGSASIPQCREWRSQWRPTDRPRARY